MAAVLFYVQHLLGIGHLMRARFIAEALATDGFDVHLVCGGRPVGGRMPNNVRTVQLPSIHASDASLKPLLDADGVPIDDAFRTRRRDLLLATFDSIAPAAVVFETFPFGRRALQFELLPLLERIESTHPRPLVVCSVRDILQQRQKIEREREMLTLAQRSFDAILIHGDRRFARFEETFPSLPELDVPVHYTGFVVPPEGAPARAAVDTRREIVVSAGGGTVGMHLLRTALAAQKVSRLRDFPWRLLVGSNVSAEDQRELERGASPGVVVEPARADFPALLGRSLISVSQAGYNTSLDVVRSGVRAVVVPYTEHGETEQRVRAARLAELDLAIVIDDAALSPTVLAEAVDAAGAKRQWGQWDYDCDGAVRSSALIAQMLATVSDRRMGIVR